MPRTKNKRNKLHVRKGDEVALTKTITGSKNIGKARTRGYVGRVLKVFPKQQKVIVEGVNLRYHHEKPSQQNPQGGRVEKEMPIHVSNVMPIDSEGTPTRIGRKQVENAETGKARWVRYAKTNGEELDQ